MDLQKPCPAQSVNGMPLEETLSDTCCPRCRCDLGQNDRERSLIHSNEVNAADIPLDATRADFSAPGQANLSPSSHIKPAPVKAESDDAEPTIRIPAPKQEADSQSSTQRHDDTCSAGTVTRHWIDGILRALLSQYDSIEAKQDSAAETLSMLQRDLLQLRVDRMENEVDQDNALASLHQTIERLEESLVSMKTHMDRLMQHPNGLGHCPEQKMNAVPVHVCPNAPVLNSEGLSDHAVMTPATVVRRWSTECQPHRTVCKRKRNLMSKEVQSDLPSKRRCTSYALTCPVNHCAVSDIFL